MPNYFSPYQQMYQPNYFQNNQQAPVSQNSPIPQVSQQIQNGGFVSAPNEDFARNFPVGYGNSVNFKDEHAPYIYVKTMGLSQFDNPVFEKYRLVKEEPAIAQNEPQKEEPNKLSYDELKAEIEDLRGQIEELREKVALISEKPKGKTKKEVEEDA